MPYSNRLKQVLSEDHVVFGVCVQIPSIPLIEIMGRVGYDFAVIDTEHGLYDIQTGGELIRASQGANLTPLVRVLKNDKALIMKALDLGAQGVIVPHIANKEDASEAVEACAYGPVGRGACQLIRAADYGLSNWQSYQEEARRNILLFLIIEDLEGVSNIEEILSVSGVDGVWLGAFDMSVAAGYKGNIEHPEIRKALDRILAACKKHGIWVMHTLPSEASAHDVDRWIQKGVRFVVHSSEGSIFGQACHNFLRSVSHLRSNQEDRSKG